MEQKVLHLLCTYYIGFHPSSPQTLYRNTVIRSYYNDLDTFTHLKKPTVIDILSVFNIDYDGIF